MIKNYLDLLPDEKFLLCEIINRNRISISSTFEASVDNVHIYQHEFAVYALKNSISSQLKSDEAKVIAQTILNKLQTDNTTDAEEYIS
jgi:hypothetical protein